MRYAMLLVVVIQLSCMHIPSDKQVVYSEAFSQDEKYVISLIVEKFIAQEHSGYIIVDSYIAKPKISGPALLTRLQSEGIDYIDSNMVMNFTAANEKYSIWPPMSFLPKNVFQRKFDAPSPRSPLGQDYLGRLVLQISVPSFSSDGRTALCYYEWMYYGVSGGGSFITSKKGDKWVITGGYQVYSGG